MSDARSANADEAAWRSKRSPLLDQPPRRGGIANVSPVRFWLAAFLVAITPGASLLWANLYVSGYGYNDDGSRNVGHLAKAIPTDLVLATVVGLVVLGLGLLAVRIARRDGVLAAPRLLLSTSVMGLVLGLVASGALILMPENRSSAGRLLTVFTAAPVTAIVASALLCLEFIVVSRTPVRVVTVQPEPRHVARDLIDRAVMFAALVAAIAVTAWVAQLVVFVMQHPCRRL